MEEYCVSLIVCGGPKIFIDLSNACVTVGYSRAARVYVFRGRVPIVKVKHCHELLLRLPPTPIVNHCYNYVLLEMLVLRLLLATTTTTASPSQQNMKTTVEERVPFRTFADISKGARTAYRLLNADFLPGPRVLDPNPHGGKDKHPVF